MKKFIFALVALMTATFMVSCSSCSGGENATFGVEYSLNSNGLTEGKATLVFPNGNFQLNGTADYKFAWTNAVDTLFQIAKPIPLTAALSSNDTKTLEAATYVNNWLESSVKVIDAEGKYDIYVKGYVRETYTKLTFEIDKHFTNIPEEEKLE
jgi:hypothetical protein